MIFKILLILLILILQNRVHSKQGDERVVYENHCCLTVWLVIVFMVAFRSPDVGMDSMSYYMDYKKLPQMTFADLAESQAAYIGYFYSSKVFSLIGIPTWGWFGFVEALYVYSLSLFVNKFSRDRLFSILIFVTTGLFSFSFSGMKQVMAMAFMMLTFMKVVEKKYIIAIPLALFAYKCHPSSVVFLIAFPFYLIREKRNILLLMFLATGLIIVYSIFLMTQMFASLEDEHFESYLETDTSYSSTTLIFYIVLTLLALINYKTYSQHYRVEAKLFLGFTIMMIGLQALSSVSPNMFRLAFYFAPFMMILLPNSLKHEMNNNQLSMRAISIIIIALYYLYTSRGIDYQFLWQ